MNISDATLLERWTAERDAEAFQELVSRHAGMVFATCLRILGNREDANDTAQACFIKLAERVRPTRDSLTGLLHTMARRESYNLIKSHKRRQTREQTFSDAHTETTEITFDDVSTHVDEAIGALPEKERAVIVAHFLEGHTHDAIAEELGVGRSTVSYRISKGADRIRASLAKQGITASATSLAAAMTSATAEAAPAGLVAAVGKLAIAGTAGTATPAVATGGMIGLMKIATATTVLAIAAGGGFLIAQSANQSPTQATTQPAAQSSPTANNPASTAPTSPPTLAAAVETDSESDEEEITAKGTVVSAHGFSRPDVEFFNNWPFNPYSNSPTTDDDGRFSFAIEPDALESWMLYSHNTQTAALISTDALKDGNDLRIVMDMKLVDVVGRVVQADGEPDGNTQIQFRLTAPDGATHISKEFTSNKHGIYSGKELPSANGWTIEARVIPSEPKSAGPWQMKTPLLADSWAIDLADITESGDAAPNIDKNATASTQRYDAGSNAHYGGVVKDLNGKPIEGVLLKLMFDTKNGMMDTRRARSDGQGKWRTLLPANLTRLTLRAQHLDFVPTIGDPGFQNPPLARMQDLTSEFVMRRGTEIQGAVRNQMGEPVGDVLILGGNLYSRTAGGWERTANAPMEDLTTVRSDKEGRFRLGNLMANKARLQFLSYDYAPQVKKLIPEEFDGPLEIVLHEGGTIRGRFIDVAGDPIPGTYIYGNEWVMDEQLRLNVRAFADDNGVFELKHIPIEGTKSFSFGARDSKYRRNRKYLGMSANSLTPREEPYEITMFEPITFTGRVVDTDTGEPIKRFTVRTGWERPGKDRIYFNPMASPSRIRSDDGTFEKKLSGVHVSYPSDTGYAIGILADGYIPATSALVKLGEAFDPFEIRLQQGTPFDGRIVNGDGKPVQGVEVAWIGPGETAHIQNGRFDNRVVSSPSNTDKSLRSGKFGLPPSDDPGLIFAVHAEGYAVVASSNFNHGADLTLLPWAKVHGVLHGSENDVAMVQMRPLGDWDFEADPPTPIRWNFWDASHTDGRFEFAHVPAIPFEIGRLTVAARTTELSHGAYLTPDAGKIHNLVVGGDGARVTGSIEMPDDTTFEPHHVRIAAKALDVEGEIQPRYVPKVNKHGAFEIADIPPGRYALEAFYHAAPMPMVCGSGMLLAQGATEFVVPEGDGGPFQIGSVAMDILDRPKIGSTVPDLAGWTFDEEEFSLDAWKGKFVVLDFWASWCPPCRSETPKLKELRNTYPSSRGIEFVGLNFDHNAEAGQAFAKSNELDWPQLNIGEWNPENVILKEFGVTAIPSLWLIGPEGDVLGRDLSYDALQKLLEARVP